MIDIIRFIKYSVITAIVLITVFIVLKQTDELIFNLFCFFILMGWFSIMYFNLDREKEDKGWL